MHASIHRHPYTSNVVRSRATEENGKPLEVIRQAPPPHRRSGKNIFLKPSLVFKVTPCQWR